MDIGHDTMGTIIINSYAFGAASVSAVSDIYSEDDNGTGATGDGNSKFTKTVGGSATHDQRILVPLEVSGGQAVTVGLNGEWTGTATSLSWAIIEVDNAGGLVTGISPSSATSADFDPVFTIAGGAQPGDSALYQIQLVVVNSGGTTTKNWDFLVLVP
jgi:hypothetical protein